MPKTVRFDHAYDLRDEDNKLLLLIGFFYRKLKIMNEYNELLFSAKKEMRTFNFVPRCNWVPLGMGLHFLFQLPNCSHFAVVAKNSLWD